MAYMSDVTYVRYSLAVHRCVHAATADRAVRQSDGAQKRIHNPPIRIHINIKNGALVDTCMKTSPDVSLLSTLLLRNQKKKVMLNNKNMYIKQLIKDVCRAVIETVLTVCGMY